MVPDTRPPKPVPTAQPLWWLLGHIMETEVEKIVMVDLSQECGA